MNTTKRLDGIDILLILGMILPFVGCMVLKILTSSYSDDISVEGAQIFYQFNAKSSFFTFYITEAQFVSVSVLLALFFLCLFLTRGLSVRNISNRQVVAEFIVKSVDNLVQTNMGSFFADFAPFIAALLGLSACSSLSSLLGLYPPTADINVIAGWGITVFILIT